MNTERSGSSSQPARDWRLEGVRVVRAGELDANTPQTPGMTRAAAITTARAGAERLWAGTVVIDPDAKTGAHLPDVAADPQPVAWVDDLHDPPA